MFWYTFKQAECNEGDNKNIKLNLCLHNARTLNELKERVKKEENAVCMSKFIDEALLFIDVTPYHPPELLECNVASDEEDDDNDSTQRRFSDEDE